MNKSPKANGVQLPFNDENFIQKWQEWLQYRKERRLASYVPTGLKKTFTKLLNDSQNDVNLAIQIIDQAMSCNWQGLFPLKTLPNATNFTNPANGNQAGGISNTRIQAAKNF